MILAQRARQMKPSPTLAIDSLAKQMKAEGVDIVGFGAGEPDFDTPEHIRQAAIEAINGGFTRYTAPGGIPELKEAIRKKLRRDNGLDYELDEIVVSVGAKHVCYNAFQVLLDPGDEVIVPAPYWVSYLDQIHLAQGVPVIVQTREEDGFVLKPELIEPHLNERTRAIVINTPNNPTGAVIDRDALKGIAELLRRYPRCIVLSDEIYEFFLYDGHQHVSFASLDEELKARTLTINGVSKTYAMTGWRIGYAAGPKPIIKAMADLQSHSTSNPTSIAQKAAIAALEGPQQPVQDMLRAFTERRRYILERLQQLEGVTCTPPGGAFYVFPRIDAIFGRTVNGRRIETSADFARALLEEVHVAVVPGDGFGAEGYVRLSYATSMKAIEEGLNRIESFWRKVMR